MEGNKEYGGGVEGGGGGGVSVVNKSLLEKKGKGRKGVVGDIQYSAILIYSVHLVILTHTKGLVICTFATLQKLMLPHWLPLHQVPSRKVKCTHLASDP